MTGAANPAGAALNLRDIHLPAEPSWWPPAVGWWMLAALLLVVGWYVSCWLLKRVRMKRRVRVLLNELSLVQDLFPNDQAKPRLAAYSDLLRRACRQFAPAALVLSGESWLEFLDGEDADKPFSVGAGRVLLHGPFQANVDPQQVAPLAELMRARLITIAEQFDA